MIRYAAFGAVLCILATGHAHAATPNFDTPNYCRATIMGEGPFTQEKYDYCLQTEHSARGMVGRFRVSRDQTIMNRCITVARTNRDGTENQGSYGILVTCLEGKEGIEGDDGQSH